MLAGRRAQRLGDQILKEMAFLLLEKVRDPRVKGVTLTGIRLSNDLKNAKVYFSVLNAEKEMQAAQAGLDSAKGFIKRELGGRLKLRYFPEIGFEHDPSLETADRIEDLLESLNIPENDENR